MTNERKIYQIDEQLNLKYITELKKVVLHLNPFLLDVDQDGNNEIIFSGPEEQSLIVTRSDFSNPVKLSTPNNLPGSLKISMILKKNKPPLLFIHAGQHNYTFQYEKNPLYSLQYAIYFGIYLLIFLLVFVLEEIQKARVRRKYETEKRIMELQLTSAKNQMSPHFTLNLMQSIATLFDKRDREKALNVLGKFTKMLRDTLINSDQILVTLKDELDYVNNYLELEQFRYSNKFEFEITVAENLNTEIIIPKTLIHTFVENAVKHGIKHLNNDGRIQIIVTSDNKNYTIEISDNGVGRKKAKEYNKLSTGKGMNILDLILDYYRKEYKIKIKYKVIDLIDNFNHTEGTKVIITIPLKLILTDNENPDLHSGG